MSEERLFGGTMIKQFWTKTHRPGLRRTWRPLTVCLAALGLLLSLLSPVAAGDGALDPTFPNFGGVQKIPYIRNQADYVTSTGSGGTTTGVSLICGYFTSINDASGNHPISGIAKLLDTAGTVDTTFNIPIVGEVRNVFLTDPTSLTAPILIGGNFSVTGSDNIPYYNLARLTWTGAAFAVDTTFPHIFNQVITGSGTAIPVSAVNTIAVQGLYPTGYLLVGGYNLQVQGDTSNHTYHLIRLNPLNSYNWDSAYSTSNPVRALPGGYVNGINLSDTNFPNQARIFGTLPRAGGGNDYMQLTGVDLSTIVATLGDENGNGQLDGATISMAPSGTGWVIVGQFKHVFGYALNGVARLNSGLTGLDSTAAGSFNDTVNKLGGADHTVTQIWGGSNVVVGGNLTSFNGVPCGKLVRLDANGNVDPSFNTGGSGLDDRPWRIYQPKVPQGTTNPNFQILGAFRHYNGTPRGGIVTLSSNGSLQPNYANVSTISSTPGTIFAMGWGPNGQQIIGGDFTGVGGKWHQGLAAINWDGSVDSAFLHNVDGVVRRLWGDLNGNMLVAGNFGLANAVGRTSVARLNGSFSMSPPPYSYPIVSYSLDMSFNPKVTQSDGTTPNLHMITTNDNTGTILIGGDLAKVGDASLTLQPRTAVARLQPNGDLDSGFTFTPPGALTNLKVKDGGAPDGATGVYILGKATYNGGTAGFCTYLLDNGGVDPAFGPIGSLTQVDHFLLFDGQVLCGGGNNAQIYLGGDFTHVVDGATNPARNHLVRMSANGILDTAFVPPGPTGPTGATIATMQQEYNGKLLIGGLFTSYDGVSRNNVARLNADGSLDLNFDPGTGTNGPVLSVDWDSWNGKATVTGAFTTYNNNSWLGFARIICGPIVRPGSPGSIMLLLGD